MLRLHSLSMTSEQYQLMNIATGNQALLQCLLSRIEELSERECHFHSLRYPSDIGHEHCSCRLPLPFTIHRLLDGVLVDIACAVGESDAMKNCLCDQLITLVHQKSNEGDKLIIYPLDRIIDIVVAQ